MAGLIRSATAAWISALALVLAALPARAEPVAIPELRIEGVINPIKARYVKRALADAAKSGAPLCVLSINTPGGLVTSMQSIVEAITASKLPVVGIVEPKAAQATSAGAIVLLATDVAVMLPDTRVGAAHPVGAGEPLTGAMEQKATNSMVSLARSLAQRRARSPKAAEAMVRSSASYTAQQAKHKHLVELIEPDKTSLLGALDGYKLDFPDRSVVLTTHGSHLSPVPMSFTERGLDAIADPTLASILLSIGVLGIIYELSVPGIGLGGIVGVVSLLLGLLSMSVLPLRLSGALLIVAGIIAIALEVKASAHGLLAAGGIGAIAIGAWVLIDETEYFGSVQHLRLGVLLPILATAALGVLGLATIVAKAQRKPALVGLHALDGARGVAKSAIRAGATAAEGSVLVQGARWQASADHDIAEGESIKVVAVLEHPTRLQVARAEKA